MNRKSKCLIGLGVFLLSAFFSNAQAEESKACPKDLLSSPPEWTSAQPALRLECVTGDSYSFTLAGYKPGEIITPMAVQLTDPTKAVMAARITATGKVNDKGNAVVQATFDQPSLRGKWGILVTGSQGSKASGDFEFKPVKKFLVSAKQMPNPAGGTIFLLIGSGWEANEPLSIGTQSPQTPAAENPTGKADAYGFFGPFKVPFVASPADGDYKIWLKGASGRADLTITCKSQKCSP